jgi:hypothetical protein
MTAQSKCNDVLKFVEEFKNKFAEAFELGLPPPWNSKRWFYSNERYEEFINIKRNNHEQFNNVNGPIRGIIIYFKNFKDFILLCIITYLELYLQYHMIYIHNWILLLKEW